MSYFSICPDCKANLDPGEHCDCGEKRTEESKITLVQQEENDETAKETN